MAIKIMGLIRLKDNASFEIYRTQVGKTIERYNGSIIVRGAPDKIYWNELPCASFDAFVELSFPTAEDADRWVCSPEYQAIVPIRTLAMDLMLFRVGE